MGDALAVALINKKQFRSKDFRRFHPGGALGQRLSSEIRELMLTGDGLPIAHRHAPMDEAIQILDRGGLGTVLISETDGVLAGIITDGDIRRFIVGNRSFSNVAAETVMTANPLTMQPHMPTYDALNMMEKHQITVLPITDSGNDIVGILHLHDILGKGEFKFNGT